MMHRQCVNHCRCVALPLDKNDRLVSILAQVDVCVQRPATSTGIAKLFHLPSL